MLNTSILISIVICTADRSASLQKTIQSLNHLSYNHFEVIIVDSSANDNTLKMLNFIKQDLNYSIKIFISNYKNLSVSRNIGIQKSSGEIVAFIDDDAIPPTDWLDKLISTYSLYGYKCAGVGGTVRDMTTPGYPLQYHRGITNCISNTIPIRPGDALNYNQEQGFWYNGLMGTNSSYRKEFLEEINGYDEFFEYFLDETDVCLRLIQAGYEIHYCDTIVDHYPQPSHNRYDQKHLTCWYSLAKNTTYFALKHAYKRLPLSILLIRLVLLLIYRCLLRITRLKFTHRLDNQILWQYVQEAMKGVYAGWSAGMVWHHSNDQNISRVTSSSHKAD
ncbi:glycosyltransferase family 2 protein [Anabaena cylindrica FACHB-243]|uniref:Glycosyl transferase family 2 n=1 Tax=Anabaena cylindrica (strain ATCC 27899 / PCC 7122) TaxID=272123 RepID=K9ZPJ8_ANACC|nr:MULTISPECIES: glycosyltransferase family A protein [Anabaena]AFZ60250.1 glycosyl transferase family 2 [Anabaena cylindrica PCC 7122]MBD2417697.1 glycosyltransferase family 2 protein [Anabaena cylindrica FACHB-243]MBY5281274.1 glycosyltransferase [Anabaena sp. CCAP 1446/1C]MBY5311570.1 glycosyltransferase [Anabaena sp. CCAP 1446/1C]MCM2404613.1 glycosyltransferase family 2 protein [Anabaena sp. CCAP 1446/1C]